MNEYSLIYPMFAMVNLTFIVLLALFRARVQAVRNGKVSGYYFKTYQDGVEPESSLKLSQHFVNIFEAPTLFYVVCLAAMIVGESSLGFQLLAWLYVLLRAVHAYVHTGSNKLRKRVAVYFYSWLVLLAMWAYLTFSITVLI